MDVNRNMKVISNACHLNVKIMPNCQITWWGPGPGSPPLTMPWAPVGAGEVYIFSHIILCYFRINSVPGDYLAIGDLHFLRIGLIHL